jgi:sugar/nucleoside kinase (ribokinase family)
MHTVDVVVAGHICLDITPKFLSPAASFRDLIVPGQLINVGDCVVSTGGPVSNTGLSLVRLGVKALLNGKVGDDTFGRTVIEKLDAHGCGAGIGVVKGETTSYTIVLSPPGLDRVFLHNPGANNTYGVFDVNYDLVARAQVFHLGYPPLMRRLFVDDGKELVEIYRRAKEAGATTSLDLSVPDPETDAGKVDWARLFSRLLPYVDLFLPSAEEILYCLDRTAFLARKQTAREKGAEPLDLFNPEEYSALSGKLIEMGAGMATLKSGHKGVYIRTSADSKRFGAFGRAKVRSVENWCGRELWEPAFHIDRVASATGAGDCCIAGFLASFLRGEEIEDALRYATAAGRQNVSVHDATSGIRSLEETREMIKGWRKSDLSLSAAGWKKQKDGGAWAGPHDRCR